MRAQTASLVSGINLCSRLRAVIGSADVTDIYVTFHLIAAAAATCNSFHRNTLRGFVGQSLLLHDDNCYLSNCFHAFSMKSRAVGYAV